jgi:hypothetical protein
MGVVLDDWDLERARAADRGRRRSGIVIVVVL